MFKSLVKEFCDLVLGPEPSNTKSKNIPRDFFGHITELCADEPEEGERFIEWLLTAYGHKKAIALLGGEGGRFNNRGEGSTLIVMPAQSASQMLFAAHELIKSGAIDVIVLQEIFLKGEPSHFVVNELRKLRTMLKGSIGIVLINPNSTERKLIAGELQLICSPLETCAPEWKKRRSLV